MVVASGTLRDATDERRVRVQPDVAPVRRVTRDCFIAEAYGSHCDFAAVYTMI